MGIAFILLAAVLWGLAGGVGGVLLAEGWDAFVVAFYRGAIGLLLVLGWLALRPHGSGLRKPQVWGWAILAGVGVAGNFSFYFVSIAHGSVAVAATLMYCAPVFVYLVSFLLKLERPSALKWAAIAMVMVGILLLTNVHGVGAGGVTVIGVAAGLLAGLGYAVFIFGFKYAARYGSPPAILSIAFAVLAAVLVWPAGPNDVMAAVGTPGWPLVAGLGVFGAGLSFVLYVAGLNKVSPAVASIVAMVEPVTASLFGVAVLDESLAWQQLAGMVLILFTVTLLGIRAKPAKP